MTLFTEVGTAAVAVTQACLRKKKTNKKTDIDRPHLESMLTNPRNGVSKVTVEK